MKNFRIYKYQWGLWLAEYLPGREIWYKLHFLRVKWEMLGVYSKSFLAQLTFTITCHVTSSLARRAWRVCLKCLHPAVGGWGNDVWVPQSQRLWNLSLSVFVGGFSPRRLLMGKQSLDGSLIILCLLRLAFVHCDVVNDFPLKMSPPTRWHSDNKNRGWTREAALQKGFFTVPHPPKKIKQIPGQTPLHPQEVLWIVKCPSESGGLASASGSARESRVATQSCDCPNGIYSAFWWLVLEWNVIAPTPSRFWTWLSCGITDTLRFLFGAQKSFTFYFPFLHE